MSIAIGCTSFVAVICGAIIGAFFGHAIKGAFIAWFAWMVFIAGGIWRNWR